MPRGLPPLLGQQASMSVDDNDDSISPSVRLALKLSTLPSEMFDAVLANLATLPYNIWDDDEMSNVNPDVLFREMDARRARMSSRDKVDTAMHFIEDFDQTGNPNALGHGMMMLKDAIQG
jgi:hypothetical protein